eukprot:6473578-Pyramimonas_sp.AAC.1
MLLGGSVEASRFLLMFDGAGDAMLQEWAAVGSRPSRLDERWRRLQVFSEAVMAAWSHVFSIVSAA